MREINTFLAFLILVSSPLVSFADEIFLKNGNIVQCNIIEENKEQDSTGVDVVLDGQLAGVQVSFNNSEINEIKRDGKYADLKRNELNAKEKSKATQKFLKRINKGAAEIDKKIEKRVSNEAKRLEAIDARMDKKERERLKAERRLELLEKAAEHDLKPNIYIVDK